MLGSWEQPRVRRSHQRFSRSLGEWLGRFGSVVKVLLWANIAVFVAQILLRNYGVVEWVFALRWETLTQGFVWQPLTYMFLHAGLFHILINMLILWFIGHEVEYFIGSKHFARLYFLGGLCGAALWLAFNLGSNAWVVGASAAVLACVIAFATLFPNREITLLVFFVLPVTLKAKYLAIALVVLDLMGALQGPVSSVAHLAHLGGAALGYIYIKQLGYGVVPRWLLAVQSVGHFFRSLFGRSPRAPRPEAEPDLTDEDYIRAQIDPILDKISREGIHSLTRRERKILESAKDILDKKRP
jgi:membrane associated rhomboid family serine protease